MTSEENIEFIRKHIDDLDKEIAVLIAQRLLHCTFLAKEKKNLNMTIFNNEIAQKRKEHFQSVIGKEKGEILYNAIHQISVKIQQES